MQASYVDVVVFPDQQHASGLSGISSVESLLWKSNTKLFTSGIATFRKSGTKVAVDDYGLHESNAHRVDLLRPDIVKIDRLLTQNTAKIQIAFFQIWLNGLVQVGIR